ncbi:MAG: ATP-binding cassette domain-containing protein, partial [Candidatus Lokiarchaeota archaeon]|nr:ATP-binding cassette domain-containing protein [Candidatus Lokiarchaeota archaeon]
MERQTQSIDENKKSLKKKEDNIDVKDSQLDDGVIGFEEPEEIERVLSRDIIRCNKIVKDYDLDEYIVRAVEEVSVNIERYDFVAIQGVSGAGKTTLLHTIAGLDNPTKGNIFIEWVQTSDLSEEMMATFRVLNIGFIFQNYNLISSLTAEE